MQVHEASAKKASACGRFRTYVSPVCWQYSEDEKGAAVGVGGIGGGGGQYFLGGDGEENCTTVVETKRRKGKEKETRKEEEERI